MEKEPEKITDNLSWYKLFSVFGVLGLFILVSYLVRTHETLVVSWVDAGGIWSPIVYFFLGIVAVVVPPFSNFFLIPVAAAAWGPFATGVITVTGWGIGAVTAFYLARRFGEPLRLKFPSLASFPYVDALISKEHPFWSIVLLRMTIPVDVLSYGLGFFTKLPWRVYLPATFAGITPFAFFFPYASNLPFKYQLVLFSITSTVFVVYGYSRLRRVEKSNPHDGQKGI